MYINSPSGKNYSKVTIEDGMLTIRLASYDYEVSTKLDAKCIPQLIEILQKFEKDIDNGTDME